MTTPKYTPARILAAAREMFSVCQALDGIQRFYAEHAEDSEGMPGNQFYSDKLMEIVRQARAAIAKATGEQP